MACAGALSACWVQVDVGGNNVPLLSGQTATIGDVIYKMDVRTDSGVNFNLYAKGAGSTKPTFSYEDMSKFTVSIKSKETGEYYFQDQPLDDVEPFGDCGDYDAIFRGYLYWSTMVTKNRALLDGYKEGDQIQITYTDASEKKITWTLPTAVQSASLPPYWNG